MHEIYLKYIILIICITIISIILSQVSYAQITATQMGMLDFKVHQNLSEDEMNGIIDVTEKLQTAVDTARLSNKTLFIASGTYKISNTINCILEIDNWWLKTPVCIVGSAIDPPIIKLEDNLEVFNGEIPKAVFHYNVSDPDTYGTDGVMEGGLRSINFDLGSGNTKAVAIYWGCAQNCFVEDIHINAGDGFAGLTSIGGANNLVSNVYVTGGQYGIYLPNYNEGQNWDMRGSPQNTINGCKFINQSITALWLRGWGGITLVGIDIVKNDGIAIKMDCETYAPLVQFPFSIIDSKIEFNSYNQSNCAIKNLLQGSVSIRGLYVKKAGIICDNNNDEDLVPAGQENDWTAVYRYNYIDKDPRAAEGGKLYEGKHFDAIRGIQYKNAIIHMEVYAPPSDLISRHIWESTPFFEDDDAVLVTSAGEIQSAIDSNQKVCIAKGTYTLSEPIILKENTILIGCPGRGSCGTIFEYGWTPDTPSWLIETENSASATTYLLDITTNAGQADYEGSVHWQAGENSIIRDLWTDKDWIYEEHDNIHLYISGNGGGRIFNYPGGGALPNNPNHRIVKVSGTSQQLTFYGLNLERGGTEHPQSEEPMLEIDNSSNIRIFGAKTETSQPYATINNSENIFLTSIIDLSHFRDYGLHYIQISGSSDKIEITNSMFIDPESPEYKIVNDPWNSNEPSRTMHLGLYHRNWTDHYKSDSSVVINGVEQTSVAKKWFIYPNPTTSEVTIKLKSAIENSSHCYIYNSLGIKVKSFELPNTGLINVDISNFTNGIYFIQIQSNWENLECFKILKK